MQEKFSLQVEQVSSEPTLLLELVQAGHQVVGGYLVTSSRKRSGGKNYWH